MSNKLIVQLAEELQQLLLLPLAAQEAFADFAKQKLLSLSTNSQFFRAGTAFAKELSQDSPLLLCQQNLSQDKASLGGKSKHIEHVQHAANQANNSQHIDCFQKTNDSRLMSKQADYIDGNEAHNKARDHLIYRCPDQSNLCDDSSCDDSSCDAWTQAKKKGKKCNKPLEQRASFENLVLEDQNVYNWTSTPSKKRGSYGKLSCEMDGYNSDSVCQLGNYYEYGLDFPLAERNRFSVLCNDIEDIKLIAKQYDVKI